MKTKKRTFWKNALTSLVSLLIMLLLAEAVLRLLGYQTWKSAARSALPAVHEPDKTLGWQPVPGTYHFPPYDPSGNVFEMTVSEERQRITQSSPHDLAKDEILLIGGSFTFGWAISDHETFAWKLQQKYPDLSFKNLGVNAYGTYQSLLRLETALKKGKKPEAVIYGFIDHHSVRNIAKPSWISHLSQSNGRELANVPYATLNPEKQLVRHSSSHIVHFPLREYSVLFNLTQNVVNHAMASKRLEQREAVLAEIVRQMHELCLKNGADFYVVSLNEPREAGAALKAFLDEQGIKYLNCSVGSQAQYLVPGDGHPNGAANTLFAQCIAAGVISK